MKKLIVLLCMMISMIGCSQPQSGAGSGSTSKKNSNMKTKILFINSSQNKDGNTVKMARDLFGNIPYDQVNLVDYRIAFLGQKDDQDEFADLLKMIQQADTIVIGTPVYWHSMSGALKTMIDRSDENAKNIFNGKKLYFFMQGAAPTELSKQSIVYAIQRFAAQMNIDLKGTATDSSELAKLRGLLNSQQK